MQALSAPRKERPKFGCEANIPSLGKTGNRDVHCSLSLIIANFAEITASKELLFLYVVKLNKSPVLSWTVKQMHRSVD